MTAAAALKAPIPPSNETGIPAELKKSGEAPKRGIYERINAVMRDVRGVGKSKENRQFGYSYAGHEDVTEALRDAYSTHGIVRSATVLSTQIIAPGTVLLNVRVSWVCHDEPSSLHAVEIPALQTSSRKDRDHDPMQIGKALSYAVKNAEFKIFALTGDDTPDVEEDDVDRGREPPRNGASGGPSSDNGAPRDEGEALARGYIDRFGKVQTDKELSDLNAEARANWARFRHVPGVAERMVAAKKRASERLRQKAPQQRQPGED